jgi:trimeric autotransporter adhesin
MDYECGLGKMRESSSNFGLTSLTIILLLSGLLVVPSLSIAFASEHESGPKGDNDGTSIDPLSACKISKYSKTCPPHDTSTTVIPNPATTQVGKAITFKAKVVDTNPTAKVTPTGTVTWDDGGAGGTFSPGSCTLAHVSPSTGSCAVKYTPTVTGPITIKATYAGDSKHNPSSGTSSLTSTIRSSSTTVSPNPAGGIIDKPKTFKAKVADTSPGTKTAPTGTISWSDGGAGGTFSPSPSCTLAPVPSTTGKSACTVSYTPSVTGSITMTATYSGDSTHNGSSGTSTLTVRR